MMISLLILIFFLLQVGLLWAARYELTRNNIEDPNKIDAQEVSLYRVKLGDAEETAIEYLVEDKISGIRVEQEGTFILLWNKGNPTGAMAGVGLMDGKVNLIFINNRFAYKTRGLFRRVLNAKSTKEVRKLLGKEDYGDENVMGAMLHYETKGFVVNYLGRDINVEFQLP